MAEHLMGLPFAWEVLLPGDDQGAELDIILYGSDDEELLDEESLQPSGEAVELFALATNEQLFSKGRGRPVRAMMELLDKKVEANGGRWRYRYRVQSVPPEAFLILLALLTQTAYAGEPLERVSIQSRTPPRHAVDTRAFMQMDRQVPQQIINPPFPVEYNTSMARKHSTVTMEFVDPIAPAFFAQVSESYNIWDHLVAFGGFHLDFLEQEGFSPDFGRTTHLGPRTIEHSIDNFDGYESAFHALVNLGAHLHAEGHAIETITIE